MPRKVDPFKLEFTVWIPKSAGFDAEDARVLANRLLQKAIEDVRASTSDEGMGARYRDVVLAEEFEAEVGKSKEAL